MAEQKSAERRQRWNQRRNGCWRWVMAELWLQGEGQTPSSWGDTADFVRRGGDAMVFDVQVPGYCERVHRRSKDRATLGRA